MGYQSMLIVFLFLKENICCGYSLEASHWDNSKELQKNNFYREIRKILTYFSRKSFLSKVVHYSDKLSRNRYKWLLKHNVLEDG